MKSPSMATAAGAAGMTEVETTDGNPVATYIKINK